MLNVLALEVLVTDEFLPLLPWEVREEREGVSREESLPQRDGKRTYVVASGVGLGSTRFASRTSFSKPFPITSAICEDDNRNLFFLHSLFIASLTLSFLPPPLSLPPL